MYLRYFNILYSNADILTTSCWLVSIKYWKLKNHKFFRDQFPVKDTEDPDIVTTLPRSKIEEKLPAEQNVLGMDDSKKVNKFFLSPTITTEKWKCSRVIEMTDWK